jgi:outer membrane protein
MRETPACYRFLLAGCLAVLWIPAAVAASRDSEFPDTTLAGIYELAVDNDLTIKQARAELRVGAEERKLARAGLLPQIGAGASYSELDRESRGTFSAGGTRFENNTDLDVDTDSWDVSLRQPLFDLPAWFRFRQGVELSRQAESTFTLAQQLLILRSVTAYFEVLRTATNLQASRAQESALKAQLDQVKQRFEVGMVAITDVHEAQAGFDLAVAQRISDEGLLGIARELLSVLTGRAHGELWVLEDEFPVVDPDPTSGEDWVRFAHQNNFDIQVAVHARDAAQRGARAAASEHLPTVDLSLSYADSSSDILQENLDTGARARFPDDEADGIVAINLTLPLFTGGFTSASRRQAAARYDTQIAGYEGTVRRVIQETRASHIQVLSDVARTRARAQAVTSTRSALEAAEVGYDVGTRNVVDVLRAQQEFFSAVRDYENSKIDYVVDLVRLKRLAGTLSPEDVYELNQWLSQPPAPSLSGQGLGPRR